MLASDRQVGDHRGVVRTLTSLLGNSQRLDGGAMFGNVPRALWSRWMRPDERNRIELACRCLLVRESGRNVLFETGIGAFFPPRLADRYGILESEHVLERSLAGCGLSPADIHIVVFSHLHFDHAGGALTAWRGTPDASEDDYELFFENAHYLVSEAAWRRACAPHPRDRASFIPALQRLLERSGRLELVTGQTSSTLGPGYRFHLSDGHTPGLLMTEIHMPDGPVVFVSDLVPGRPWVHLPVTMGYDRFPEKLIDEKRALFRELLDRGGRLFFTHDPEVAISGLARDERGHFVATDPLPTLEAWSG